MTRNDLHWQEHVGGADWGPGAAGGRPVGEEERWAIWALLKGYVRLFKGHIKLYRVL